MRALSDIIIIEKIKEEVQSSAGFVWSDKDANEMRYHKGKVLSCGPKVEAVSDGDVLYYDKHRAYDTSIEGSIVTVIRESDGVVVLD